MNDTLKTAMMEIIENQLEANDPPETQQTLDRLMSEGLSEDDAMIHLARAVSIEVYATLKHQQTFDLHRYTRNLKALPAEPRE